MRQCPPLDTNSCYLYLLLCHHFSHTCVVAQQGNRVVGFVSAYLPPGEAISTGSSTTPPQGEAGGLFIWQVAVHPDVRGQGLATRMLLSLLERDVCRSVRFLETTISPSNQASQRLFEAFAQRLGVSCERSELFAPALFGGQHHEAETLFRIGPIDPTTLQSTLPQPNEVILS